VIDGGVRIYSWAHHGTTTVRYEADDATLLRLGLLPPERVPSPEVRCYRHADDQIVARLANGQVRLTLQVDELRAADAAFGRFMDGLILPNGWRQLAPRK
jgi:hypothetical protein